MWQASLLNEPLWFVACWNRQIKMTLSVVIVTQMISPSNHQYAYLEYSEMMHPELLQDETASRN